MTRTSTILFFIVTMTACTAARAPSAHVPVAPYAAAPVRTISGDTLVLRNTRNQNIETVRLAGLASPATGQAFSTDAAYELQKLIDSSSLIVSAVGRDENGHLLVYVCVSDEPFFKDWKYPPCKPEDSVNHSIIRDGLAWVDTRQPAEPRLREVETQSKEDRVGLWQQLAPIPPWQWTLMSPQKQAEIRQAEFESQSRKAATSGRSLPSWTVTPPGRVLAPSGSVPSNAPEGTNDEQAGYYWLFRGMADGVD
jgi:endonuclease YncB( thermonuclease family)